MQRVGQLPLHQWLTTIAIRGLTRHQLKQTIDLDGKRTDAVKRMRRGQGVRDEWFQRASVKMRENG